MLPLLIGLLVALLAVVVVANSRKQKGEISDSAHQLLISGFSIVVTLVALAVLFRRLRG